MVSIRSHDLPFLKYPARPAFTLAELLIALAILGVIATFTIPKVLQSQQDGKYKAIAKEAGAAFTAAYSAYQLNGSASANTSAADISPYLNYVRVATSGLSVDDIQTQGTMACNSSFPCYILHNGAALRTENFNFGGTGTTNALTFLLDPDGKVTDSTTDGPGKSLRFFLYYPGRLSTYGSMAPNTHAAGSNWPSPSATADPPWFSWN
jgi:prepilin-type N-terminal cleavage/methylation domain-containing protein